MRKLLMLMLGVVVFYAAGCSCDSWTSFWGGNPKLECCDHWHRQGDPACPRVTKAPPMLEEQVILPCAAPSLVQTSRPSTAGVPAGREINLSKLAPKEVALNEPFNYRLKITNQSDQELLNVVVSDVKPAHMRFNSSDPEMQIIENEVRWQLGALGPNESKTISVEAVAIELGTITSCAEVTYDTPTCAKIEIVDPKLLLAKVAPLKSLKCDRIPLKYIITNTGTGHACNVVIEDIFNEGMMTAEGANRATFSIEVLGPGETHEFETMVDASRAGRYVSRATATAAVGGTAASEMIETTVSQPVLAISGGGPSRQYLGRPLTYELTITNNGDAIAKDTIVEASVPEGIQFNRATAGGNFTRSSPGKVTWNIGTLEPGETKKVSMTLTMNEAGELITTATAKAYCAETVSDSIQTSLEGIPAILIEVVDVSDPIEVGQDETYVITVTNQGSEADTGIRIDCTLDSGMQYVSSSGPTTASVIGNQISFAPLPLLAPKDKVSWRVTVKASSIGDKRFKATMNSDQLERIVEETEATRFYK